MSRRANPSDEPAIRRDEPCHFSATRVSTATDFVPQDYPADILHPGFGRRWEVTILNLMLNTNTSGQMSDLDPIVLGIASVGEENAEAAALREALQNRGAIVQDWPLSTDAGPPPQADVLLVAARVLDVRVSALIQKVGALTSPYLIVLSETGDVVDRIVALEMGADDFLRRDSDAREILARAKSLIRRGAQRRDGADSSDSREQTPRAWVLNDVSRLLRSPAGTVCELSKGDVQLIDALVEEPSEVFTVEKDSAQANSLRVSISRLRRKFRKVSAEELPIRNIWGLGYAFDAPLERVNSRG